MIKEKKRPKTGNRHFWSFLDVESILIKKFRLFVEIFWWLMKLQKLSIIHWMTLIDHLSARKNHKNHIIINSSSCSRSTTAAKAALICFYSSSSFFILYPYFCLNNGIPSIKNQLNKYYNLVVHLYTKKSELFSSTFVAQKNNDPFLKREFLISWQDVWSSLNCDVKREPAYLDHN